MRRDRSKEYLDDLRKKIYSFEINREDQNISKIELKFIHKNIMKYEIRELKSIKNIFKDFNINFDFEINSLIELIKKIDDDLFYDSELYQDYEDLYIKYDYHLEEF